jgi:hypothetical protein
MTIDPRLGVAIMMNNYFHDVATALLAASGFVLWAIGKIQQERRERAWDEFFVRAYDRTVLLARIAFVWILLGGVPRTYFYQSFEWANAAGRGQVPALIVKHVLMFALVGLGGWAWFGLSRRVGVLRSELADEAARSRS